jgi:hypothetical protein
VEFAGPFHRQQVTGVGHHADLAVAAFLVAADLAELLGRKMETAAALPHLAAGGQQGIGETADLLLRLAQKMQGQALGRAGADARQALELIDQPGQGSGETAQRIAAGGPNLGAPCRAGRGAAG